MIPLNETINITGIYHKTFFGSFFLGNMFIIMSAIFFSFFLIILLNTKYLRKALSGADRKTLVILVLILIFGFLIRNSQYEYGLGYDGVFYTGSARTWLQTGVFMKSCAFGDIESCCLYHQVLFPAGFPFMILLLYLSFGVNSLLPMMLTGILSTLTILLVFLIARILFNNDTGLYSAAVFSLIPIDVAIAGTGAVRSVSLFFIGLTVLSFLMALKHDRLYNWLLVSISLSLSIYLRQENSILLIPLFLYFLTAYKKNKKAFLCSDRFILPASLLVITQIPVQHWILFMGGLGGNPDFSLSYLPNTLPMLLGGLFSTISGISIFNPLATVIFLSSIILVLKKGRVKIMFLWAWFLVFFTLYSLYFFSQGHDFIRYMSALSIPYAMLSGASLFWVAKNHKVKLEHGIAFTIVVLFFSSGIMMPATIFRDARLEEPFLVDELNAMKQTSPSCGVIIANHAAIAGTDVLEPGRRWIDLDMANDALDYILMELERSECFILVYDSWLKETELSDQYPFLFEYLEVDLYMNQNTVNVYNVTLKREP